MDNGSPTITKNAPAGMLAYKILPDVVEWLWANGVCLWPTDYDRLQDEISSRMKDLFAKWK